MAPIWILFVIMCYQGMKSSAGNPKNETRNQELEAEYIFQRECPPTYCSAVDGPVVKYPLHLQNKPNICSNKGLALSCSGNTTLLNLPSGTYNVTSIFYPSSIIVISLEPQATNACLRPDTPYNMGTPFYYFYNFSYVWLNCLTILPPDNNYIMGPISCLSEKGKFIYLIYSYSELDNFTNCTKFSESNGPWDLPKSMSDPLVAYLNWNSSVIPGDCSRCFDSDEECGLWLERNTTLCYKPLSHRDLRSLIRQIITSAIGPAFGIILIIGAPVFVLIYQKHKKTKEVRRKMEQFLESYNATNPTRYSYSEIIKMTKRFKTKLGQDGFGAVFKGLLPNGIPVAVKILQVSAGNGDEFINEVSTIGRIHHVNVVHLLGFCSEGRRRALVYELMENGSLDKYIFYKQLGQVRQRKFNLLVLQNMVISIAEGIEYLHQGCNQRIVHLDIKPHNILLDHNFNPKISDFGLSKICPKDQSYVTVSVARGTLSYMAPEMYSRNFGIVSYKSDVYSFGMLILEMVSGRRNKDPLTGNRSDVYFPELIHEQLIRGEDLHMILDSQSDDMIARNLVTVALWCIQWSPADRPTMGRVIKMLKGDVESLPIPPKPSIS